MKALNESPLGNMDMYDRCSAWYSVLCNIAESDMTLEEAIAYVEYDYGYRNDPDGPLTAHPDD